MRGQEKLILKWIDLITRDKAAKEKSALTDLANVLWSQRPSDNHFLTVCLWPLNAEELSEGLDETKGTKKGKKDSFTKKNYAFKSTASP